MRGTRLLVAITIALLVMLPAAGKESRLDVSRATVKIIRTSVRPDYNQPWKMKEPATSVGSGAIISGKKILTNAHVVSDATYIQVKKESDPELYDARIIFIAHDCDLALLEVNDPGFYNGTVQLGLGGIPELRSKVTTYGYPMGGSRISITEGITSRIEIGEYAHSGSMSFLLIQTDAAINPGNSGGPVMQGNLIAGIAFQGNMQSENIGYLIPTPIIRHFLDDIRDGRYNGFPMLGAFTDPLENISFRRYLGMKDGQSGIIVTMVLPGGGAEGHLRQGDVITAIDSVPIANDGTIRFSQGRIYYSYVIDTRQVGEPITLNIIRKGRPATTTYPMKAFQHRISWFNEYETLPRYCIFGGLIFQPLSKEYLMTWDKWWHTADRRLLYYYQYHINDRLFPERKEFILLNGVLPDEANTYLSDVHDKAVDSINGVKITKLGDVPAAFNAPRGGYHVIRLDGTTFPLVLKASEMDAANIRIQKKYNIPSLVRLQ